MPPAINQLFTFNDVAAEVAAGRMLWSGAAQSGTSILTWSQYITYVMNDGTNPAGYASNQCVRYDDALARAVIILDPTGTTADIFGTGKARATWSAPTSGLAPTSYIITWTRNSGFKQTQTTAGTSVTTTASGGIYTAGDIVGVTVQSVNGTHTSPGTSSGANYSFTY